MVNRTIEVICIKCKDNNVTLKYKYSSISRYIYTGTCSKCGHAQFKKIVRNLVRRWYETNSI